MDNSGPAFPEGAGYTGLTKRELAAMFAMVGWIVVLGQRYGQPGYSDISSSDEAGRLGNRSADALLAALKEEKP